MVVTDIQVTDRPRKLRFESLQNGEQPNLSSLKYHSASYYRPQFSSVFNTIHRINHFIPYFIKSRMAAQPVHLYFPFTPSLLKFTFAVETRRTTGTNGEEI
jgi:hypothetical protein